MMTKIGILEDTPKPCTTKKTIHVLCTITKHLEITAHKPGDIVQNKQIQPQSQIYAVQNDVIFTLGHILKSPLS